MKLIMATEAQRLIGISLAKIAQSKGVRGGVSLHKNLLVATVLQKARYLFMEEAFHMVHGHYINQQNSKLIEQQQQLLLQHHCQKLQQLQMQQEELLQRQEMLQQNNQKCEDDDSELESIFNPLNSLSSSLTIRRINDQHLDDDELDFFNHSSSDDSSSNSDDSNEEANNVISNKENNPPSIKSDLSFLDLEVSNSKRSSASGGVKRRLDMTDWDNEETILSIIPKTKQAKFCEDSSSSSCDESDESVSEIPENSLDFLSNNNTNVVASKTESVLVTNTSTTVTPIDNTNTQHSQSIDRITSLVSIFNFGNLQRSTPDLCSSQASKNNKDTVVDNNCVNLNTQRQYLAMTV